ncbi:MAG: MBL fold metallo-hydrolase [Lachnospiraceae bacterium]|nr:MBL fold metallo-hydrolase [Lachnospiraceae bacterium]
MLNAGSRIVNNWIYPIDKGYVLIDTGYESGFAHFKKQLAKMQIVPQQIRYIFLTHAHDDHAGYLNEVLSECPDLQIVLFFCYLMKFVGKGKHLFPSIKQEYQCRCIQVTEQNRKQVELLLQGKIIDTPGHTADSISLLLNDGSLFCGDAAMNGLPSLHRITIWAEDKTAFLKSWETIIALRPNLIYPGHGKPFEYKDLKINLKRAKNMELLPVQ